MITITSLISFLSFLFAFGLSIKYSIKYKITPFYILIGITFIGLIASTMNLIPNLVFIN